MATFVVRKRAEINGEQVSPGDNVTVTDPQQIQKLLAQEIVEYTGGGGLGTERLVQWTVAFGEAVAAAVINPVPGIEDSEIPGASSNVGGDEDLVTFELPSSAEAVALFDETTAIRINDSGLFHVQINVTGSGTCAVLAQRAQTDRTSTQWSTFIDENDVDVAAPRHLAGTMRFNADDFLLIYLVPQGGGDITSLFVQVAKTA